MMIDMGERLTPSNYLKLLEIKTPHTNFQIQHYRAKNKLSFAINDTHFNPTLDELDAIIDTLLTYYERKRMNNEQKQSQQ